MGITNNLGNYSVIQYYCKQHDPRIKKPIVKDKSERTDVNPHIMQSDEREVKAMDDFAEEVKRDWNERNIRDR